LWGALLRFSGGLFSSVKLNIMINIDGNGHDFAQAEWKNLSLLFSKVELGGYLDTSLKPPLLSLFPFAARTFAQ
jgi:hypothetical protein